jgi:hypothetical protein
MAAIGTLRERIWQRQTARTYRSKAEIFSIRIGRANRPIADIGGLRLGCSLRAKRNRVAGLAPEDATIRRDRAFDCHAVPCVFRGCDAGSSGLAILGRRDQRTP